VRQPDPRGRRVPEAATAGAPDILVGRCIATWAPLISTAHAPRGKPPPRVGTAAKVRLEGMCPRSDRPCRGVRDDREFQSNVVKE
jgi:hypothetical protein